MSIKAVWARLRGTGTERPNGAAGRGGSVVPVDFGGRGPERISVARRPALDALSRFVRPDGHGRGALLAYGALGALDLLATVNGRTARGPARAAKPLLMPALAAHALRRRAPQVPGRSAAPREVTEVPRPLVAGLACAAAGDTALLFDRREPAFLAGMAAFLGTQLSYTAGMAGELGAVRGLRDRPRTALGCLAAWGVANAVLAPALGPRMRLPVAGYSFALAAMGAAAFGVGGKVGAGAAAFLGSDALIGLQAAGHRFLGQEPLIMAGYLAGQYLITTGWLEHREER